MAESETIPAPAPTDLPTFEVLIDGEAISGEYHVLQIVSVKAVNKIAYGKIVIADGDPASQDFVISSTGEFAPGKEIEVQMGYHNENTSVFQGVITKHAIKARLNQPSVMFIEMRDAAVKTTVGKKSKYYFDVADSDILDEIIGEYDGLTADIETTDVTHARMVKYYSTDWDFINYRADANGKLVFVNDGEIAVKAPDTSGDAVLSLTYGTTMLEFEAQADARDQLSAVTSSAWNFASQELSEGEAAEPDFTDQGALSTTDLSDVVGLESYDLKHTGSVNDEELQAWADGVLQRSRFAKVRGRVKCQGFADIKPGDILELAGVGEQFNGDAYVAAVRQELTPQNWTTNIQFGLDPELYCKKVNPHSTSASGLLPPINGLQIGIVNALEDDPDGEDRVQVKVPVIDGDDDGVWARVSTLDAGDSRGSFFRPEIGDEVVLGFLNDDPRDAIILGMLNSSAKPAPLVAADDNHIKGFVTRSGLQLLFDDETSIITLETPNGNTMVFNDDETSITIADENDNQALFDPDGITLTDAGGSTISMTSDGITLDSSADINMTATGDVNVEGINIACAASAEFTGEGNAGAKLSSGAIATIEGGVVMIN